MKAFRYRLASVLSVRRLQQDQRQGELAAAAIRRRNDEVALEAVDRDIARALDHAPSLHGPCPAAWSLVWQDGYLAGQRQVRRQQAARVRESVESETAAWERWSDARRETRMLEVDQDRAHADWAEAQRREEGRELDEIGARRYAGRREIAP